MIEKSLLSLWSLEGGARGVGNPSLLDQPLTAFFASRQCPGTAIRAAMAWAIEQSRGNNPVISGFHSPLEQSVLEVMLTAGAPCVIVVARKLDQARLTPAWLQAAHNGKAAIISIVESKRQLTADLAARRNDWVAEHAARIIIAHASFDGNLLPHARQWAQNGLSVDYLS